VLHGGLQRTRRGDLEMRVLSVQNHSAPETAIKLHASDGATVVSLIVGRLVEASLSRFGSSLAFERVGRQLELHNTLQP
jgi:hypothetical protein